MTPLLPVLIPVAFGQYVIDSYVWHRQRQLRASRLGRWNGILYFVPLVLIAASRLGLPGAASLLPAAGVLGYVLVASTVVSVIDRATTPVKAALTLVRRAGRSGPATNVRRQKSNRSPS